MEFTGERFVPELGGVVELEHIHRYLLAKEYATGKQVLDIACGEGYGTVILADSAAMVTGVDISSEAIEAARLCYSRENVDFLVGSCSKIPAPDASFDLVVSFETIEHHDQHDQMMKEIKRVLRPAGILVMSSPDKHECSVKTKHTNPFHVKELFKDEFEQLINEFFLHVNILGQRVTYGSCIFQEQNSSEIVSFSKEDDHYNKTSGIFNPVYIIVIASDSSIEKSISGTYERPIHEIEVVKELIIAKDKDWHKLADELEDSSAAKSILEASLSKEKALRSELKQKYDDLEISIEELTIAKDKACQKLKGELEESAASKSVLEDSLAEERALKNELKQKYDDLEISIEELTIAKDRDWQKLADKLEESAAAKSGLENSLTKEKALRSELKQKYEILEEEKEQLNTCLATQKQVQNELEDTLSLFEVKTGCVVANIRLKVLSIFRNKKNKS